MYAHQGGPTSASFDSVRASRGSAYVPQLGPKEMSDALYRHVEALTRAEPAPKPSALDTSCMRHNGKDDSVDEDMDDASSKSSASLSRSSSPSSPSLSIYPRVTSGDPSRRLPSPTSRRSSSSISSILDSRLSGSRTRGDQSASMISSSPSPPPSRQSDSVRSSPSPMYPSLSRESAESGEDSMDGIEEDVAAMDVASPAASVRGPTIPTEVRQSHAKLILDLLIALNFPEQRPIRLAPIKSMTGEASTDLATTPTAAQGSDGGSDETEQQCSTPKLDTSRTLPNIASLLNDVNVKTEVKGAGGRRIMDVNV